MAKIHVHPQTRIQTRELPHSSSFSCSSCHLRGSISKGVLILSFLVGSRKPNFQPNLTPGLRRAAADVSDSGFTCPLQTGTVFPCIRSLVIIAENLDQLFVLEAGSKATWYFWNSLCKSCWLFTYVDLPCLYLLVAGIKGVHHYTWSENTKSVLRPLRGKSQPTYLTSCEIRQPLSMGCS